MHLCRTEQPLLFLWPLCVLPRMKQTSICGTAGALVAGAASRARIGAKEEDAVFFLFSFTCKNAEHFLYYTLPTSLSLSLCHAFCGARRATRPTRQDVIARFNNHAYIRKQPTLVALHEERAPRGTETREKSQGFCFFYLRFVHSSALSKLVQCVQP